jgi:hypothetical protein
MKYGSMTYPSINGVYNIGDYIQGLAARQYLPRVDYLISREHMNTFEEDDVKMIMNGWYMHKPENWPPSDRINPLYVSFHMNHQVSEKMFENGGADYLKKYQPIGCRDFYTKNILTAHNIEAYYSACLTTTLDVKYKSEERNGSIYLVDPLFSYLTIDSLLKDYKLLAYSILKGKVFNLRSPKKIMKGIFDSQLLKQATSLTHLYSESEDENTRFRNAEILLSKYAKAKLVITSRIHCALPCLALGTPVIFINGGFDNASDNSRFVGITELFNTINIDKQGNVTSNFGFSAGDRITADTKIENPKRHVEFAEVLKKQCREFIERD